MTVDQTNDLTGVVIGGAIAVHRELGPGVEEAAYEAALSKKLTQLGVAHECQKALPLVYKGVELDCGFRLDVLVNANLPVELKAVERVHPVHDAQLLSYMRLGCHPLGLLMNFEVPVLKDGIRRKALTNTPPTTVSSSNDFQNGFDPLSTEIVRAALEVHRSLGPGLIRSVYEECLCHELHLNKIDFTRSFQVPLSFEGKDLPHAVEVPLVVENSAPVFCLSVSTIKELHISRMLARLRQTGWPYGLLINFNSAMVGNGIRRVTLS